MNDQFDEIAAEMLPCKYIHGWCGLMMDAHQSNCAAFRRTEIAAALRTADQQGYRRGVEEAARYKCRWCSEGEPLDSLGLNHPNHICASREMRTALLPAEPEEQK